MSHDSIFGLQLENFRATSQIDLSASRLESVPEKVLEIIRERVTITNINLKYNRLSELHIDLFSVSSLKILDVSSNQLTAIPNQIGELSNLTQLIFHDNLVTELPNQLKNLQKLISIAAQHNRLTVLDPELSSCASLMTLDVSHNQIKEIPRSYGTLANLVMFEYGENPLVFPPTEMCGKPLKELKAFLRGDSVAKPTPKPEFTPSGAPSDGSTSSPNTPKLSSKAANGEFDDDYKFLADLAVSDKDGAIGKAAQGSLYKFDRMHLMVDSEGGNSPSGRSSPSASEQKNAMERLSRTRSPKVPGGSANNSPMGRTRSSTTLSRSSSGRNSPAPQSPNSNR